MKTETWYVNKGTAMAHFVLYGSFAGRVGRTGCGKQIYNESRYVELTGEMNVSQCKSCLKSKWRKEDE